MLDRGSIMDDHKKYTSFKIAFGVLVVSTMILVFSRKSRVDALISGIAAIAIGIIFLYFKLSDLMEERRKKAHKMHLDK